MEFKIIDDHSSDNLAPLMIKKGERVKTGKKSSEADGWANWIYCWSIGGNSEGWAPVQIIEVKKEYGMVLEDYSAEELTVKKGDVVKGDIELNGWFWCSKLNTSENGWLPKEKMVIIENK